ncbi:receptor-transporting protein 5 [Myotis yumanensis]|uniref:receptor-transporting protein 5 n=1 Tax=Myotis yumanensis TaxID=159337 RepID=UPI0038CF7E75
MDGMDVWVSTLAQLMAKRKPEDTWELVLEENLSSGHLDSGSYEYRLRGLSRLQCNRCQWGWSSAHVHILFHVRWDKDRHLGLVKMRIWAQACQLCPPDARGDCQVSLLNVRLFLNKLVLFVLQQCYQESISSDECPEVCFGDHCEACDLGVCFFQKPPDPAWGPETRSPSTVQAMPALGSGPVANCAWGFVLPSVSDPLSESSHFFSEDMDIITVPFTLVSVGRDKGSVGPGEGTPSEAGLQGLMIIDRGSADQPASLRALPTSMSILVNIKAPILHGRDHLLRSIKSFQVKGFIFKGFGSLLGQDKGLGADPSSNSGPTGDATLPVSYVLGLTEKGEGSITFPLSLANIIQGPDSLPDLNGSLTFPFIITDQCKGGAEYGQDPALSPASSGSRGSLIIPFSAFSPIKLGNLQGSSYHRSGHCGRHRRHRARRPRARREEDFLEEEDGWCWPSFDPYEEVWVWMCMVFFVLWTLYLCTS